MYPRNAASPERIPIGPVVQISDGAVQTAGVTVRVLPFGGSEADGAGTTAYSTDGVVLYTPTQAETNYTSFVLIAKKSACIPASVFVVTSESTVSGRVYVATNGDKTGYTATVSDKTGFSLLATTGLGNQTANITGNLTGNVTGSVGGISGVTFPANFGSMVINAGNGHVAVVVHSVQAGAYTSAAFASGWLTAAGLASDAANEIANAVAEIQVLTRLDSMIESDGSGQFRFDTVALSMGAGGAGGTDWTANERTAIRTILGVPTSGTTPTDPSSGILDTIRDSVGAIGINVYPVSASTPERVAGTTITYYRNEIRSVSVVTDFTLTSLTLSLTIEDAEGTDLLTIPNGSISRSSQTFTVSIGTAVTASVGNKRWALRDITGGTNSVIARGVFSVQEAASA
jgi:hypothetical protein